MGTGFHVNALTVETKNGTVAVDAVLDVTGPVRGRRCEKEEEGRQGGGGGG